MSTTRDDSGRVTSVTDAAGETTSYAYDYYDNVIQTLLPDPDGSGPLSRPEYSSFYDGANRLQSQTDPSGTTSFQYDFASNLSQLTDASGNTSTFDYDGLNRLVSDTDQIGNSRIYTYDVPGNLVRLKDRNDRVTEFDYDSLDRSTSEKWLDAGGPQPVLEVETLTDGGAVEEVQRVGFIASGATGMSGSFRLSLGPYLTTFIPWNASAAAVQSALEQLPSIGAGNVEVSIEIPDTYSRNFVLRFVGGKAGVNVAPTYIYQDSLRKMPNNAVPQVFYQTLTTGGIFVEQQKITFNGAYGGTWQAGFNGEVTELLPYNVTTTALQNALNSLASIDSVAVTGTSGGLFASFTLTFGGSQSAMSLPEVQADGARLSRVAANSSPFLENEITSEYNVASELTEISDDSATYQYTRDKLGRITEIINNDPNTSPGHRVRQEFDSVGNRTQLSTVFGTNTDVINNYTYDKLRRLTDVTQQTGGSNAVQPKHVHMNYNLLGQMTSVDRFESTASTDYVGSTYFSYDTANRLSQIAHKFYGTFLNTHDYTYDPISRLDTYSSSLDGLTNYSHSQNSELTEAINTGAPNESYGYDATGNRDTTGYTVGADNRTTESPGYTYTYDNEGRVRSA
jgi:YD repeat-containing protein